MPVYGPSYDDWLLDAIADGDLLDCQPVNGDQLSRYFVQFNENFSTFYKKHDTDSVNTALWYLYSSSMYLHEVLSKQWRGERTTVFFDSVKKFYKEGLDIHCVDSFDENCSPLNSFCCSLWHMGGGLLDSFQIEDHQGVYLSLDVLEYALNLGNLASQHSALVGLVKIYGDYRRPVKQIISEYLSKDVHPRARDRVSFIISDEVI